MEAAIHFDDAVLRDAVTPQVRLKVIVEAGICPRSDDRRYDLVYGQAGYVRFEPLNIAVQLRGRTRVSDNRLELYEMHERVLVVPCVDQNVDALPARPSVYLVADPRDLNAGEKGLGKGSVITIIAVVDTKAEPLDADAVADAFAEDLQSDVVTNWADAVKSAIAVAQRLPNPLRVAPDSEDPAVRRERARIEAQIGALQGQLVKLERM